MKKNKSRSKTHSTSKKTRKELETKLALSFNEVVNQYGKSKKADKVIGKFAKQLAKKVSISGTSDSITPFIKEETPVVAPAKEKPVKVVAAKKVKAPVKEEAESK